MTAGQAEAGGRARICLSPGEWLGVVAIAILAAFPSLPGRMNPDAVAWFDAFRYGPGWDDWHIPLLLWVWWKIGMTPALLAVQTILVAVAMVACVAWLIKAAGPKGLLLVALTAAFSLFPSIYGYLVAVSKDTWVALAFLALFVLWSLPRHRGLVVAKGILVALATVLRPETMLLVPAFVLVEYVLSGRRKGPAALVLVVALGVMVAQNQFVYRGLGTKHHHPEVVIYLFDLAGISLRTGEMLLTPAAFPAQSLEVLEKHYFPEQFGTLAWEEPKEEMVVFVLGKDLEELRARWIRAIVEHPGPYLQSRVKMIRGYFKGRGLFEPGITPNEHVSLFFPDANEIANSYLKSWPRIVISHWLPFFGTLVLLALLWWLDDRRQAADRAMLAVGFVYHALFLVLTVSADFRFAYASVVVFYLVVLRTLLINGRRLGEIVPAARALVARRRRS